MTARLAAAEALVDELRARLEVATGKLSDTQAELATARDEADAATARVRAAIDTEQALRQGRPAKSEQFLLGSGQLGGGSRLPTG